MSLFDTDALLANIKGLAFVPTAQRTYTNESLLTLADNEIQTSIVPQLMSVREEYFVTYSETPIVQNQVGYDIPSRAIGVKLKDVTILSNISGPVEVSVPIIESEDVPYNTTSFSQFNQLYGFLRSNKLCLTPANNGATGMLRLYYFLRPSKLVAPTAAARVDSVDTATNTVTLANLPTTYNTGVLCDFVRGRPHFNILQADAEIVTLGVNTITFASLPDGLAVGDYVALAGESPIPQIPFEFFPILAQRVAVKILETQGDDKALAAATKRLAEMEKNAFILISPRVEGEPKKIVGMFTTLRSPRFPNRFGNY